MAELLTLPRTREGWGAVMIMDAFPNTSFQSPRAVAISDYVIAGSFVLVGNHAGCAQIPRCRSVSPSFPDVPNRRLPLPVLVGQPYISRWRKRPQRQSRRKGIRVVHHHPPPLSVSVACYFRAVPVRQCRARCFAQVGTLLHSARASPSREREPSASDAGSDQRTPS